MRKYQTHCKGWLPNRNRAQGWYQKKKLSGSRSKKAGESIRSVSKEKQTTPPSAQTTMQRRKSFERRTQLGREERRRMEGDPALKYFLSREGTPLGHPNPSPHPLKKPSKSENTRQSMKKKTCRKFASTARVTRAPLSSR